MTSERLLVGSHKAVPAGPLDNFSAIKVWTLNEVLLSSVVKGLHVILYIEDCDLCPRWWTVHCLKSAVQRVQCLEGLFSVPAPS